jgi:hypothetical protein
MLQDFTTLALPQLLTETEAIANDAQAMFGKLSAAQVNWKPAPDSWSVAQCLDHLMTANRQMFPVMAAAARGAHRASFWERVPLIPGLLGKFMVKAVSPQAKQRVRAPAKIRPSASALDVQIVAQFVNHQREVAQQLQQLMAVEAERIVMTSPLVSVVTYSLLDASRLIIAHQRRHLAQAARVQEAPGFPA